MVADINRPAAPRPPIPFYTVRRKAMLNILEKTFLFGLGTLAITKNKAEAFVREASKEANLSPEEGNQLLNVILEEGKNAKANLNAAVEEVIASRGQSLIPGYKSISSLEKRIADLEDRLAKLEPAAKTE
jgi:polyhydroxyalkanoate synthesis regulator phasin